MDHPFNGPAHISRFFSFLFFSVPLSTSCLDWEALVRSDLIPPATYIAHPSMRPDFLHWLFSHPSGRSVPDPPTWINVHQLLTHGVIQSTPLIYAHWGTLRS
ncbi:hypothetical protein GGR50DRAFT_632289 [Xylaria sp. CBS 124048]|nr:hypothetical protein GGR50DRAFT_632289 [Xylaria sp. CBS 124048]